MDKNIEKALLQLEKYDFDHILFVKKRGFTLNHTKEIIVKEFDPPTESNSEEKISSTSGNIGSKAASSSTNIFVTPSIWGVVGNASIGSITINTQTNGTIWFSYGEVEKPDVIKDHSTNVMSVYEGCTLDDLYDSHLFSRRDLIIFQVNEESDGIYFPNGNSIRSISFWQESEKIEAKTNTVF
jgi:hypothetical protein